MTCTTGRMAVAALLFASSAILPIATAQAAGCQLALAATLPLIEADQGRKLLVDVTVDGQPVRLILDTGSDGILLDETVANKVSREIATGTHLGGLNELGTGFTSGIGGSRAVSAFQIGNLGIGRMHGRFSAMATSESFARDGASGLMGMSVLGNFDLDLNLPAKQLRLFSATGACSKPVAALDAPVYAAPMQNGYRSELRVLVPVQLNGQTFTALLDTGAPGVLLFASTATRLGLAGTDGPSTKLKIAGFGGAQNATLGQLQTLSVGQVTLKNVPVAIDSENLSEADLLLGLSFARRVHLWVSNSSHTLVMQYPPTPSPAIGSAN